MPRVWDVPVRDATRVRDARVAAEGAAALAGLDERRTAAAALVATELATNLLKHAEGGQVLIDVVDPPEPGDGRTRARVVQIAAIDHGPGIADVPTAVRDGYSTTRSLGAGLGTCLRLADDFGLHSTPGRGTVAVARVGTTPRGRAATVGSAVTVWADGLSGGPGPDTPGGGPRATGAWPEGPRAGGPPWPGAGSGSETRAESPVAAVACDGLTGHAAGSGAVRGAGLPEGGPARSGVPENEPGRSRPWDRALAEDGPAGGVPENQPDRRAPWDRPLPDDGPARGMPENQPDRRTPRDRRLPHDGPARGMPENQPDRRTPWGRPSVGVGVPGPVGRVGAAGEACPSVGDVRAGGVNIPYGGAEYSGDAWTWVRSGDRVTLMLADGLGHGPEAARASSAAVAELHRWARLSPAESLRRIHDALKGTRGAAVAVAQLDLRTGRLRFAGIGNVGARLRADGTWRPLLSRPGIVGVHRPTTLREEEADWAPDRLLILHTDGLPSRWTPPTDTGLATADPAVTAAVTIRDASSPARPVRDDTAVAVLTPTPPDRP
ncbi:hypothetical protein SUDANB51_00246 [Streptomyces sp. enrichment culture]